MRILNNYWYKYLLLAVGLFVVCKQSKCALLQCSNPTLQKLWILEENYSACVTPLCLLLQDKKYSIHIYIVSS